MKTKAIGVRSLNLIKNSILAIVSTLITLIIVEIILRLFLGHILYTGSKFRSLYYSNPNLEVLQDDNHSLYATHYKPNIPLRSITVYYNKVEYDTKQHTNNFGFINDVDYKKEDKSGVIFLGDSFTAGVGSNKPWLPMLNKKYPDINLYSMGVTGTGQENFYRLFDHYQDALNYDTVVIMSISDDLRRPLWYPVNKNGWLYFCRDREVTKECKHGKRIAGLIDYNIDRETLLLPEELYIYKAYGVLKSKYEAFKKAQEQKKATEKPKEKPIAKSEPVKNQKVVAQKPIPPKPIAKKAPPKKSGISLEYIAKIKELADAKGKRVIFVHIPEKGETQSGKYRYRVGDRIKAMGVEYHPILKDYQFDLSMFHVHDGHPNDKGYAYISSIIEDILKLQKQTKDE